MEQAAEARTFDILNSLYVTHSNVLRKVQQLVVLIDDIDTADVRKVYASYQHLYKEMGFKGYWSTRSADQDLDDSPLVLGLRQCP
jgi:HJR/Mrr/RecB family endonuclease